MTSPLQQTFETLAKSRNEAAVSTLIAALGNTNDSSPDQNIHDQALAALLKRRSKVGHIAVIEQWPQLNPEQRELLNLGRGRMGGALRDVIVSHDEQLFASGCELIELFLEFDLIPSLITVAENKASPHADEAVQVISRMIDKLGAMLQGPRDYKDRRDPARVQTYILESLLRSLERYRQHEREELIEAFVILSGASNRHLQTIINSPHHACFQTVINTLSKSSSPSVHQLLIDFISISNVPQVVMQVVGRRTEPQFIARLLEEVDRGFAERARKNLKRIQSLAWLHPVQFNSVIEMSDEDQRRAVVLVTATGIARDTVLDLLEAVLRHGSAAGRLAVCAELAKFQGDRPNRLVYGAIDDSSPAVQAEVTRQVRDRHIPGSMTKLVLLLDSPHQEVQVAARAALGEFTFENYWSRFEVLTEEMRLTTGSLVKKVDVETVPRLLMELQSAARIHRLRAIEIIRILGLVPEVANDLIKCLEDDDHHVRASIAESLHDFAAPKVEAALRALLQDSSASVRSSAQHSLENISQMKMAKETVDSPTAGHDQPMETT